jgi:hypothetical protein
LKQVQVLSILFVDLSGAQNNFRELLSKAGFTWLGRKLADNLPSYD